MDNHNSIDNLKQKLENDNHAEEFREDVKYSIEHGKESMASAASSSRREIEDYVQQFTQEATELSGDVAEYFDERIGEFTDKFSEWFDRQPMSDELKAEWAKARANGNVLRARLQARLVQLYEDGRLKWKHIASGDEEK